MLLKLSPQFLLIQTVLYYATKCENCARQFHLIFSQRHDSECQIRPIIAFLCANFDTSFYYQMAEFAVALRDGNCTITNLRARSRHRPPRRSPPPLRPSPAHISQTRASHATWAPRGSVARGEHPVRGGTASATSSRVTTVIPRSRRTIRPPPVIVLEEDDAIRPGVAGLVWAVLSGRTVLHVHRALTHCLLVKLTQDRVDVLQAAVRYNNNIALARYRSAGSTHDAYM